MREAKPNRPDIDPKTTKVFYIADKPKRVKPR